MIHNDPSRVPNSHTFRPIRHPFSGPQGPSRPAFPRSGWNDPQALSSSLQEAILRMRHDYSSYFNWRRPIQFNPPSNQPPVASPMYGMPNPGGGGGGGFPSTPPVFGPMYGMPNPGGGGSITPNPFPVAGPMYGMPNPGGGGGQPTPPPVNQPMYGMPNPGGGGGGFPSNPPVFGPMYGMPNP